MRQTIMGNTSWPYIHCMSCTDTIVHDALKLMHAACKLMPRTRRPGQPSLAAIARLSSTFQTGCVVVIAIANVAHLQCISGRHLSRTFRAGLLTEWSVTMMRDFKMSGTNDGRLDSIQIDRNHQVVTRSAFKMPSDSLVDGTCCLLQLSYDRSSHNMIL